MSIISELKRRNVFRVALLYTVAGWLILQVADVLFEQLGVPSWAFRLIFGLLLICFPLVLVFSWIFELTSEGIKKEQQITQEQSITQVTGQRMNRVIVTLLILAIVMVIADRLIPESTTAPTAEFASTLAGDEPIDTNEQTDQSQSRALAKVTDKSIAVLPFVNMSGDVENEYFSDGLTEELLNALVKINDLKVTGRTSSFAFKGQNADLRDIGKALSVAHILEGSVRKAQNRVRITAQLIKVDDGYHLWSETFDRELDDIFAIQEEIATEVARQLTSTLLGDGGAQLVRLGTANTQAWEAYLRGRYVFERASDDPQAQDEADRLYIQALELDPDFNLAWFGRFNVLSYRQRGGIIPYRQGVAQMRELADKIVKMAPQMAESHVASGRTAQVEMHWIKAEAAYKKALMLSPGNTFALEGFANLMMLLGRKDEALEYALEDLERDPLDIRALGSVAFSYSLLGQCNDQRRITERALGLEPDLGRFRGRLGTCLIYTEDKPELAIHALLLEPVVFMRLTGLAIAYHRLGNRSEAQHYLEELIESEGNKATYQFGQIYAQWGETEKALDALEHAWEIRDAGVALLKIDHALDPIRDHPRFIALMEKWENPDKR